MAKTFEELCNADELCNYCRYPEERRSVNSYCSGCEGKSCDEAYVRYLEEFEEENGKD
jgi:hypothetical protein